MDAKARFNSRRHYDVNVVVDGTAYFLHKFPLEAKSTFFDAKFDEGESDTEEEGKVSGCGGDGGTRAVPRSPLPVDKKGKPIVELKSFPGGAETFDIVARCATWGICVTCGVSLCLLRQAK